MSELLGSDSLPGQLPTLLEPWARALAGADVSTSHWLREAVEIGAARIEEWVEITPEINDARLAARHASVRLADTLDASDRSYDHDAKGRAETAFKRLVAALRSARPTPRKAALGLGW